MASAASPTAEPASTMSPMAANMRKADGGPALNDAGGVEMSHMPAREAGSDHLRTSSDITSSCSGLPFSPFSSQLKGRLAAGEPFDGGEDAAPYGRRGVPGHPSYQYSIKVLKWTSSGIIGEVFRMPSFRNYVCLLFSL